MTTNNNSLSEHNNPEKSQELFKQAMEMRAKHDHEKSFELFKESLKYDNSNVEAIRQVLGFYQAENMTEECISLLERSVKLCPEEYTLHLQLAISYSMTNQHEQAINLYEEIILKDPDYGAAYKYGAIGYSKIGEIKKAINCYKSGIKRFPDEEILWYGLAVLYLDEKMYYEASEALEQVIRIDYTSGYAELAKNHLQEYASQISEDKT